MRLQELFERVYREHTRKKLADITVEDVKQALAQNPDGLRDDVSEMIRDWAPAHHPGLSPEENFDAEVERNLHSFQRSLQRVIHEGRVNLYREVYIDDEGKLRRDDLGACWTPDPTTATSYNGSSKDGSAHLIAAWVYEQDVDWATTMILRMNNEEEDEIRIFASQDVHLTQVERKAS